MYKLYQNYKGIIIPSLIAWSALGFKRGAHYYDYNYNKKYGHNKDESYFYTYKILYGGMGAFLYVNPVCIFITIPKEIYRLEVNMRNMEKEKQSDFYNNILL
jgi:hypothetical protein